MGKFSTKLRALRRSQYEVIWYRGVRLDRRTIAALEHAESLLGAKVIPTQGSYNTSVGASGSTHAGAGALDAYAPAGVSHARISWAFRQAGWAWYHRPALPGVWKEHGHGILIGHPKVSWAAGRQVVDYILRLNGLASHGPDRDRRLPWKITGFSYPLLPVSVKKVRTEALKSRGWRRRIAVVRVQRVLNRKLEAGLKLDGIFGPATKAVYKRAEHAMGHGRPDGLPGVKGLTTLGASQFYVVK